MKPRWKDFGILLKEERQKARMRRAELAERLNKKALTIASWEQGYRRPKQQSLLDLSNIFGIPIQELQAKAGYTPEFNWFVSLTAQTDTKEDILLGATEDEKKELRKYLHYLRFIRQIITSTHSSS